MTAQVSQIDEETRGIASTLANRVDELAQDVASAVRAEVDFYKSTRAVMSMSNIPAIALNDGNHIPQLGFGVFQIEPESTSAAVNAALEVGYRHIDTAEMYGNEKEVGQGIRDAGLDRADVFITSKLNNGFHKPDDARRAFDNTLSALDSDLTDDDLLSPSWIVLPVTSSDAGIQATVREPCPGCVGVPVGIPRLAVDSGCCAGAIPGDR